jgi:ATP-dependent Zn protease
MNKIITKIKREKGFNYSIDKNGNVIQENYNWFKDKYTLVTLAVIILSGLYFYQMNQSATNLKNFDSACFIYYNARQDLILNHPEEKITFENVMKYYNDQQKIKELNLSSLPKG